MIFLPLFGILLKLRQQQSKQAEPKIEEARRAP